MVEEMRYEKKGVEEEFFDSPPRWEELAKARMFDATKICRVTCRVGSRVALLAASHGTIHSVAFVIVHVDLIRVFLADPLLATV